MSELFSLEKRAGLHSGSDTQEFNKIAVFKPKGYPSTPESPEITSIIITSKETEQSAGVRYALAFDLTPKETEALIFCLQNAIKKEEADAPTPINQEGMFQTLPTPDFSAKPTVLDKAKDLIYGDREKDYGKTSDNFADICTGWEIIFKNGFTPERVGLAMAWLKICRASTDNCEKEDSLIDLAGYAGCVEKIKKNL